VHESQVVRDPSTLIALLKPLLHHQPLQMMRLPVYQNMIADLSLKTPCDRTELKTLLNALQQNDVLSLRLLDHLSVWKDLSPEQRSSMLAFFERSCLICQVDQQPDARFVSARARARNHPNPEVKQVVASSRYHVLYLLPMNYI
jgi:hypothetical protein